MARWASFSMFRRTSTIMVVCMLPGGATTSPRWISVFFRLEKFTATRWPA